jgi:predicted nucleic acid-binding protein
MLVAYREDRDVLKTAPNVSELVEVRGDTEDVIAAASHVKEKDLNPFDAIPLVKSGVERIVSSDTDYDPWTERLELEELPQRT